LSDRGLLRRPNAELKSDQGIASGRTRELNLTPDLGDRRSAKKQSIGINFHLGGVGAR
jgi:hypothetical protein